MSHPHKHEKEKGKEQPKPVHPQKPTKPTTNAGELDSDGDSTNLQEDSNPNNDPDGPPSPTTNG